MKEVPCKFDIGDVVKYLYSDNEIQQLYVIVAVWKPCLLKGENPEDYGCTITCQSYYSIDDGYYNYDEFNSNNPAIVKTDYNPQPVDIEERIKHYEATLA